MEMGFKKRGRKPMDPSERKSTIISFRVSPKTYHRWMAYWLDNKSGGGFYDWIRETIDERVE